MADAKTAKKSFTKDEIKELVNTWNDFVTYQEIADHFKRNINTIKKMRNDLIKVKPEIEQKMPTKGGKNPSRKDAIKQALAELEL